MANISDGLTSDELRFGAAPLLPLNFKEQAPVGGKVALDLDVGRYNCKKQDAAVRLVTRFRELCNMQSSFDLNTHKNLFVSLPSLPPGYTLVTFELRSEFRLAGNTSFVSLCRRLSVCEEYMVPNVVLSFAGQELVYDTSVDVHKVAYDLCALVSATGRAQSPEEVLTVSVLGSFEPIEAGGSSVFVNKYKTTRAPYDVHDSVEQSIMGIFS